MFNFFQTIFDIISSGIGYIVRWFDQVTTLFKNAVEGIAFINLMFTFMPTFLIPFVTALLGIAIVKFILNLGGN